MKCGCGEVTEKETCVSLNETVPLPTGGGMHTLYRSLVWSSRSNHQYPSQTGSNLHNIHKTDWRFWEHNGS
nr:UPF0587 protein C1orf123 homolog [Ipomoea batatas]